MVLFIKKYRKLSIYIIGIIIIFTTYFFFSKEPLIEVENKLNDFVMRSRSFEKVSEKLMIFNVDDLSLYMIGRKYPISAKIYLRAVNNALKAGARSVILDVPLKNQLPLNKTHKTIDEITNYEEKYLRELGKLCKQKKLYLANDVKYYSKGVKLYPSVDSVFTNYSIEYKNKDDNIIRKLYIHDYISAYGDTLHNIYHQAYYDYYNKDKSYLHTKNCKSRMIDEFWINYKGNKFSFEGDKRFTMNSPCYSFFDLLNIQLKRTKKSEYLKSDPKAGIPIYLVNFYMFRKNYQLSEHDLAYAIDKRFDENVYQIMSKEGLFKDKIVFIGLDINKNKKIIQTPYGGMSRYEINANLVDSFFTDKFQLHYSNKIIFFIIAVMLIILYIYILDKMNITFTVVTYMIYFLSYYILAVLLLEKYGIILYHMSYLVAISLIFLYFFTAKMIKIHIDKQMIKKTFQRYMSPELVDHVIQNMNTLSYGGETKVITILFADLRNFTSYTESHNAQEVISFLKEYLTAMAGIIRDNNGIVDKFVGDGIMALWGTPKDDPNQALNACKTALKMKEKLDELNEKWGKSGKECIEFGVGINTGKAIVGNLGSEQIFDYTAIGDSVNLASRLQSANKEFTNKSHIIISEYTLHLVYDYVNVDFLGEVSVKGMNKDVRMYSLNSILKDKD